MTNFPEHTVFEDLTQVMLLANALPQLVWIAEPNGDVIYYNDRVFEFAGATKMANGKWRWEGLLHPEDEEATSAAWNKAVDEGSIYEKEHRVQMRDGSFRWHLSRGIPHKNDRGEIINWFGTATDIHEQKLAQEQMQYGIALSQSIADAVVGTDTEANQFCITSWNKAAEELYGWKAEEVIGKPARSILPTIFINDIERIAWEEALKTRGHWKGEVRQITRNGNELFIYSSVSYIKDANGKVIGAVAVNRDISLRKEKERLLRQSEERFRQLTTATSSIIWTTSPSGEFIAPQPSWEQYTGQTWEEYKGTGWINMVHPADLEKIMPLWADAVANKSIYHAEGRIWNKAFKEYRYYQSKAVPILNEEGEVIEWIGMNTDIHEKKLAEDKTKISELRFQAAVEAVQGILWTNNDRGEMEGEQKGWEKLTGQSYKEYQGFGWANVVHPEDAQPTVNAWQKAVQEKRIFDFEHRLKIKNGEYRRFSIRAIPVLNHDGGIREWVGVHTDVTEQRKAEDDLHFIKDQLELTFNNIPAAIYHFDKEGNILFLNEMGARQIGYDSVDEVLKAGNISQLRKRLYEEFDIRDEKGKPLPIDQSSASIAIRTGQPVELVNHYISKTGNLDFWIFSKSTPLYDADGKVSMVLTANTDITSRIRAEEKIIESEEQFRTLANSIIQLAWIANAEGNISWFNERWSEFTGISMELINSAGLGDIHHPEHKQRVISYIHEAWQKGEPWELTFPMRRHDGQFRWFLTRAFPLKNAEGKVNRWIGTNTDIDEQVSWTEQLEKLVKERTRELERSNEDLQQFAHVASHDLKEPIRKIRTFMNRLSLEFKEQLPDKARFYIDKIENASERMYAMIDGVLMYSTINDNELPMEKVDLNETIGNIRNDLEVVIHSKKASVIYEKLPTIHGVSLLIYQLFYNLLNNSLKFAKPDVPPQIHISYRKTATNTEIFLRDNGIGFNTAEKQHIFKPFTRLNSKDQYEGTGLGLSLCQKIVERHNGFIEADGEKGIGASFRIVFPDN